MSKVMTLGEALRGLRDGMTVMFGGFLGVGAPRSIADEIVKRGVKDLTIIANDTAMPDKSFGKLFASGQVRKVICSYMGLNPAGIEQKLAGTLEVELCPQGSLAERVRAGGAGLGGVLTPTGVGTIVEEGKTKLEINGRTYLLEMPLRADIAFVYATVADRAGNLVYRASARNFNPLVAMAADYVVAEAERVVEVGAINPNDVMTPGILVDAVVEVS